MARSNSFVRLKPGQFDRSLSRQLKKFKDRYAKALEGAYKKWFGRKYFNSWKTGRLRFGKYTAFNTSLSDLNTGQATKFRGVFKKAWKAQYQAIIQKHKAAAPDYKNSRWYKWKSQGINKYRTPHYPARKVRYKTWGLTSGFFRDAILKDVSSGASQFIKISNPMLVSAISLSFDDMPDQMGEHYKAYAEYLVSIGAISDIDELVDLPSESWAEIKALVRGYIRNGFLKEFEQEIIRK